MAFNPLTLLTLKYRGRSVAVRRDICQAHENLLDVARRTFPSLQYVSGSDVVLMAPIPESPDPEPVELLPDTWMIVWHVVRTVTIVLESEMPSVSGDTTACSSPTPSAIHLPGPTTPSSSSSPLLPRPAPPPPRMDLFSHLRPAPSQPAPPAQNIVVSFQGPIPRPARPMEVLPDSFTFGGPGLLGRKVSCLYGTISNYGYSAFNSTLNFRNVPLNIEQTFSDCGIVDGDTIQVKQEITMLALRTSGRKPVIYLYPPSSLADVTVELALASSWRFSAVHPPPKTTIPPGEPHTAQSLTWTVTAEPNGTLVDKTSGMEVSYLYWEATTNSQLMTQSTSRANTPVANTEAFDPAHPIVDPADSVLLPISKVPSYLDTALKALALHTEARTSFITLRIFFILTRSTLFS
ncbi:hypothetical protein V8E53_009246 [Lactarius tabidus]